MFLAKDLIRANQAENEQLINNINYGLIDLRNAIIRKEIPENENPNKLVSIVEKILNFNKQQKGKRLPSDLAREAKVSDRKVFNRTQLNILTPNQMLQRLPIALAQV